MHLSETIHSNFTSLPGVMLALMPFLRHVPLFKHTYNKVSALLASLSPQSSSPPSSDERALGGFPHLLRVGHPTADCLPRADERRPPTFGAPQPDWLNIIGHAEAKWQRREPRAGGAAKTQDIRSPSEKDQRRKGG
jgi:hypothetical protein